jgi:hypothetical protein
MRPWTGRFQRFWKGCKPNSVFPAGERIICLSSQYPEPIPLFLELPPAGGAEIGFASTLCQRQFQKERERSGPLRGSLFGLAPDGVFRASALALGAVGSYPTFSP